MLCNLYRVRCYLDSGDTTRGAVVMTEKKRMDAVDVVVLAGAILVATIVTTASILLLSWALELIVGFVASLVGSIDRLGAAAVAIGALSLVALALSERERKR